LRKFRTSGLRGIPPPASRDVHGIVGVKEGPEHDAGRASEPGAGGNDRHALSGKDEAERRVHRLDPFATGMLT